MQGWLLGIPSLHIRPVGSQQKDLGSHWLGQFLDNLLFGCYSSHQPKESSLSRYRDCYDCCCDFHGEPYLCCGRRLGSWDHPLWRWVHSCDIWPWSLCMAGSVHDFFLPHGFLVMDWHLCEHFLHPLFALEAWSDSLVHCYWRFAFLVAFNDNQDPPSLQFTLSWFFVITFSFCFLVVCLLYPLVVMAAMLGTHSIQYSAPVPWCWYSNSDLEWGLFYWVLISITLFNIISVSAVIWELRNVSRWLLISFIVVILVDRILPDLYFSRSAFCEYLPIISITFFSGLNRFKILPRVSAPSTWKLPVSPVSWSSSWRLRSTSSLCSALPLATMRSTPASPLHTPPACTPMPRAHARGLLMEREPSPLRSGMLCLSTSLDRALPFSWCSVPPVRSSSSGAGYVA